MPSLYNLQVWRDVTNRHNMLRNALFSTFRHASLSAHLEVGCGWGLDKSNTRPADILVSNWPKFLTATDRLRPATFEMASN